MFAPSPKGTVPTGMAVFTAGDYAIRRFAERAPGRRRIAGVGPA